MYQLHHCLGYSHVQLIRLITELYEGVPEPFEVFRCSSRTTQEELHLFIERLRHHSLTYLILEVNKLPFKLQEVRSDVNCRSIFIFDEIPIYACICSSVTFCIWLFLHTKENYIFTFNNACMLVHIDTWVLHFYFCCRCWWICLDIHQLKDAIIRLFISLRRLLQYLGKSLGLLAENIR